MDRPELTGQILLTLGICIGALVLFASNRLRVDVAAITVMAALIVTGLVTPQQGTSGFANEATITVGLMMVLAAGLARTGAIDLLGTWVARMAGKSETRFLAVILLVTVPASALINNTPVVIVLLPVILGFARKADLAPSRLLMPLSFGSQMGGTLTLIGTSTNLLVAALALELGLERLNLFTITPAAAVLAAVGVAYLLTVGRLLTPSRKPSADLIRTYELREYLTGLVVEKDASIAGKTLAETGFEQRFGLQVVAIERGDERLRFPTGATRIEAGDVLIARGRVPDITKIEESGDLRLLSKRPDLPAAPKGEEDGEQDADAKEVVEAGFAEVIVPPRSRVIGRTLRDLGFRARYGLTALALQRHGAPSHAPIGSVALEAGDILLVQGTQDALHALHERGEFALLGTLDMPARRRDRLKFALPILIAVVGLAAFNVTTILVSALLGVIAMTLTGCIRPEEAYRDVDWMVLILLGAIIPLGIAMRETGAAELLAVSLLDLTRPLGLYGVLFAFYLLTSLLTELISNNAAAVVLAPIAVAVAAGLGVSPMPFVIAVMFAASNSYMTPIGYQTNTFIYGPGGYAFSDYVRVGGPLNLLLSATATAVIPFFFPF
jgi:di/tricarboxylate transporter